MSRFVELRQLLHRKPELAGGEEHTSGTIREYLEPYEPDSLVMGLGGFGLAAVFDGVDEGPRVLVRCELDALPVPESLDLPYRSEVRGVSHKCGHDGHMAMLVALAECLHQRPPERGSVVLLFQPAEETGEGAARVLDDTHFRTLRPDYVLAAHNLPGFEFGEVVIKPGVFASASVGLEISFLGKTSHAAEPAAGNSPALAVAQLIQALSAVPQFYTSLHESAQVTVIHARLGEVAFGTSPGAGTVMATLRSHSQEVMDVLQEKSISLAESTAAMYGLGVTTNSVQPFPVTVNDPGVVTEITEVARERGLKVHHQEGPFAWSEDFGHFTATYRGALFGLGAGQMYPDLHHPDYDFPDGLIEPGVHLLEAVVRRLLERDHV